MSMPPVGFEPTTSAGELPQTYASRPLGPANYRVYSYISVGITVSGEYTTDASIRHSFAVCTTTMCGDDRHWRIETVTAAMPKCFQDAGTETKSPLAK